MERAASPIAIGTAGHRSAHLEHDGNLQVLRGDGRRQSDGQGRARRVYHAALCAHMCAAARVENCRNAFILSRYDMRLSYGTAVQ